LLSAAKSLVAFKLDRTLIRPYHVLEAIMKVLTSPLQSLNVVGVSDQLAVITASKCPA